jgi:hypothetical protein
VKQASDHEKETKNLQQKKILLLMEERSERIVA